jgi:hypothetical protein
MRVLLIAAAAALLAGCVTAQDDVSQARFAAASAGLQAVSQNYAVAAAQTTANMNAYRPMRCYSIPNGAGGTITRCS